MLRSNFRFQNFLPSLPSFNISFSWKYNRNFVDIKEMPPSKILQGRILRRPGASGDKFFSRRFFFHNISEVSAKIIKSTCIPACKWHRTTVTHHCELCREETSSRDWGAQVTYCKNEYKKSLVRSLGWKRP